jgi:hypothetical protein
VGHAVDRGGDNHLSGCGSTFFGTCHWVRRGSVKGGEVFSFELFAQAMLGSWLRSFFPYVSLILSPVYANACDLFVFLCELTFIGGREELDYLSTGDCCL